MEVERKRASVGENEEEAANLHHSPRSPIISPRSPRINEQKKNGAPERHISIQNDDEDDADAAPGMEVNRPYNVPASHGRHLSQEDIDWALASRKHRVKAEQEEKDVELARQLQQKIEEEERIAREADEAYKQKLEAANLEAAQRLEQEAAFAELERRKARKAAKEAESKSRGRGKSVHVRSEEEIWLLYEQRRAAGEDLDWEAFLQAQLQLAEDERIAREFAEAEDARLAAHAAEKEKKEQQAAAQIEPAVLEDDERLAWQLAQREKEEHAYRRQSEYHDSHRQRAEDAEYARQLSNNMQRQKQVEQKVDDDEQLAKALALVERQKAMRQAEEDEIYGDDEDEYCEEEEEEEPPRKGQQQEDAPVGRHKSKNPFKLLKRMFSRSDKDKEKAAAADAKPAPMRVAGPPTVVYDANGKLLYDASAIPPSVRNEMFKPAPPLNREKSPIHNDVVGILAGPGGRQPQQQQQQQPPMVHPQLQKQSSQSHPPQQQQQQQPSSERKAGRPMSERPADYQGPWPPPLPPGPPVMSREEADAEYARALYDEELRQAQQRAAERDRQRAVQPGPGPVPGMPASPRKVVAKPYRPEYAEGEPWP